MDNIVRFPTAPFSPEIADNVSKFCHALSDALAIAEKAGIPSSIVIGILQATVTVQCNQLLKRMEE